MSCQKKYIRHHHKEHFMNEHPEMWKFMETERKKVMEKLDKILALPKVVHVDDVRRELLKLKKEDELND